MVWMIQSVPYISEHCFRRVWITWHETFITFLILLCFLLLFAWFLLCFEALKVTYSFPQKTKSKMDLGKWINNTYSVWVNHCFEPSIMYLPVKSQQILDYWHFMMIVVIFKNILPNKESLHEYCAKKLSLDFCFFLGRHFIIFKHYLK